MFSQIINDMNLKVSLNFAAAEWYKTIKEGGGRGVARWNNNQLINGNCVLGSLGFYQTHGRVINIESRV